MALIQVDCQDDDQRQNDNRQSWIGLEQFMKQMVLADSQWH